MLNSTMLFAIRLMYGLTLVQRITLYLSNVKELESPADLYLEGSDQHRGWFNLLY